MVAHCVGRRLEPLSHSSTSTSPWQVRVFVKDVLTSVGLIKTNYGLRTPLHMPLCTPSRTTRLSTQPARSVRPTLLHLPLDRFTEGQREPGHELPAGACRAVAKPDHNGSIG